METMIKIKRFELNDVAAHSKIKYNVNNIWGRSNLDPNGLGGEKGPPHDYELKRELCLTKLWINLFHDNVKIIVLDNSDLCWIKEAFEIGSISGRFPKFYQEELENTCQKEEYKFPDQEGYFIRTDYVSLKDGIHGTGPYYDIKSVLESIVTSMPNHRCFNPQDTNCNIYLMKWIPDFPKQREFRVFICNNKITAVSDQNIYCVNDWLNSLSKHQINSLVNNLIVFFNSNIKDKLKYINTYTIDIYFKFDKIEEGLESADAWYFIEPNGFGAEYSAGSSLYHWIDDYDLLNGNKNYIEFRYTATIENF